MVISGLPASGIEGFDAAVTDLLTRFDVPGAGVAVVRNGQLVVARGYGLLDRNDPASPVLPTSRFRIASVSKPITAMTVLQLVQSGKLSLDASVWNLLKAQYPLLLYFPGFHASGMRRYLTA